MDKMFNPQILSIVEVEKASDLALCCDGTTNCDNCDNSGPGCDCYGGPCDCDDTPCDDDTA